METDLEQETAMTLTIQLPPEVEKKLRDRAAQNGLAADAYARKLIEQGLNGGQEVPAAAIPHADTTLDKILAPVRDEFEQSGMTEDELTEFLTEVRDEVRRKKWARKVS